MSTTSTYATIATTIAYKELRTTMTTYAFDVF